MKASKRILAFLFSIILLASSLLSPAVMAASGTYELTFDNIFVFEQWANHTKSGVVSPGLSGGSITKDIAAGSFTLTNNSTDEIYTAHSMGSNTGYYSMPVKPNTSYIFKYNANGTVTSFEAFVFYFDSSDTFISFNTAMATQYGDNQWTFTTPANAAFIQVRFDNNSVGSYATVKDIRICETAVYEYSKDVTLRKTYTYSQGNTYGELPRLSRDGLVFAGWYTGPDGTGERITETTPIAATSYSLYSKWESQLDGTISIASLPTKQTYCLGEKLNPNGLSININYSNGTTETLDSGFYYYPQVLNSLGQQAITVEYGGKSATFTVTVKEAESASVVINNSTVIATVANNSYTINKTASAFNRYEVHYSSDAYVKAVMLMGSTTEEFFLEPSENGVFTGYIDGYLDGTTQTQISSISFTALNKDFMDFKLESVTTTKDAVSQNLVYLSSADYKIGIDLHWGGALSYLEDLNSNVYSSVKTSGTQITEVDFKNKVNTGYRYNTSSSVNLINCNDTGRLVQQSYYGTGSPPYEMGDYNGTPWNYNPVQGGNVHNQPSKIVDLKVTENEIYVKCRPLDWGKTMEYITPSYMEAWYTLEDGVMRATCRFVDYSGYPEATTTQELPAFYCVEPLGNFVYYAGGEPWSSSNTRVNENDLTFWGSPEGANQTFYCNENWCAFIGDDSDSFGIGLYSPGQTNMFSGVFRGENNSTYCKTTSPATEGPTSYIAAVDTFTFKSFSPYSYAYYITTGTVDEIRSTFKDVATDIDDPCKVGYTNGYCNICGKNEAATLTTDKYDINNDGAKDSVYEISNAGQLHWFSDFVNAGNNTASAVLVNDITDNENVLTSYGVLSSDTSKFKTWSPIGSSSVQYKGIFDGQCHTITGLYANSSTKSEVGLFGYISSGAAVKRIGIDNSYFSGSTYVGGIVGRNAGNIENCYTYCIAVNGASYVGGISGYTSASIQNCYNIGFVDSTNNYSGGITGHALSASNLSNCYYLSDCAKDGSGTSQNGIGNATKGSSTTDSGSYTIQRSLKEFASGEVAYLLQKANAEQIWGQKTNVEGACPVFDTIGEYKVIASENNSYSLIFIGDVADNDALNIYDLQQLINITLAEPELTDDEMFVADMDGNGVLNVIDCSILERLVSGHNVNITVYLKGDLDLDGEPFTAYDISLMKTAMKAPSKLSSQERYICDLNADKVVDGSDLELLNQKKPSSAAPIYKTIKDAMTLKNKTANVIILCGQSNAYGASPLTPAVKATVGDTDFSNIKIKYNNINSNDGLTGWRTHYSNNGFETFKVGIGGQADLWFGPELGLSYFLATDENTKDEMWYIIKYTAAGTFLGGNWIYDTNYANAINAENIYNDLGGYLSDLMVDYVNASLDDIVKLHGAGNVNIRSFLWHQGESDSGFEQWANQYGALQNILVNKVRTNFESRDADGQIGFVDGGIAAYNTAYNTWQFSDIVNTHKSTNASLWYVPANTTNNIIKKTTAGLYANSSPTSTTLANSIWIDTSTCLSKLANNNENGENDGAHYCGDSMFRIGIWYAQGMLQVANYYD